MQKYHLAIVVIILLFPGCELYSPQEASPQSDVLKKTESQNEQIPGKIWFIKTICTFPVERGTDAIVDSWKPIITIQKSMTFSNDGVPTWTLPKGWSQKTVVDGRSYELVHPSKHHIEIISSSVSDILRNGDASITARLNLWRDELGLPALPEEDWTKTSETGIFRATDLGETECTFQFDAPESTKPVTILGAVISYPEPTSSGNESK